MLFGSDPVEIDEPVHLMSYQENWKEVYESEKKLLISVFSDQAIGFEHIGSTSIEGMIAKPIIDILIGLRSLDIGNDLEKKLNDLGYEGFGEAGVPGRLYYRKRKINNINLQITKWKSVLWEENILFRDYLRSHPEDANKYAEMKLIILNMKSECE
jgi:GrpB-like predicted nucleotidyltransferase (UPF0157 family)